MGVIKSRKISADEREYADAFHQQMTELSNLLPEHIVDRIGELASEQRVLPAVVVEDAIASVRDLHAS